MMICITCKEEKPDNCFHHTKKVGKLRRALICRSCKIKEEDENKDDCHSTKERKTAIQRAKTWNAEHSVGERVVVNYCGSKIKTSVKTPAFIYLSDPVVKVFGIPGNFLLSQLNYENHLHEVPVLFSKSPECRL